MFRFALCLILVSGFPVLVHGHDLPDGEIERRVQVSVKPDSVLVEYSLAMNETTLEKELQRLGQKKAKSFSAMCKQYQGAILPSLCEHMKLSVGNEPATLKPVRAVYSGFSHPHLTCLLKADIQLTETMMSIVVTDGNFHDVPGEYRIAVKSRSGAKLGKSSVPTLISRAKPVRLLKLTKQQRQLATRAEAECILKGAPSSKAASEKLFPDELVNFVPDKRNPLFTGTDSGTWDHRIRERGAILRHGGQWHLWYTGYSGERSATKMLGYATSPDGLAWTRHSKKPVFDKSWTEDVHVVHHDDTFYMVAEGRRDIPHMLTSLDGIKWTDLGRLDVRNSDGSPLSAGPHGTPTLWFENETWYLFYERRDLGIWLAKSTDRKIWTNVKDTPVIDRGPDEYDRYAIALNQVIRHKGRYYGVYHANGDKNRKGPWTTCIAVSNDLITWQKYPGNPIIRTNDSSGQLVHDGQQFRLYTAHPDVRVYFPAK